MRFSELYTAQLAGPPQPKALSDHNDQQNKVQQKGSSDSVLSLRHHDLSPAPLGPNELDNFLALHAWGKRTAERYRGSLIGNDPTLPGHLGGGVPTIRVFLSFFSLFIPGEAPQMQRAYSSVTTGCITVAAHSTPRIGERS